MLLDSLIRERNPKQKKLTSSNEQTWAKHIDRLIRLNKQTVGDIEKVIRWCQADDFWQNNILSTAKLRKQFDALTLRMKPKQQGFRDF